jgi:hypothetical protein
LKCSGSIKLSENAPDQTSVHAAAGTMAHGIAANCIDIGSSPQAMLGYEKEVDGHVIKVDQEMIDAVQVYLDVIAADRQDGDQCFAEMPLLKALSKIDPDFGGTADYVRYRPSTKSLRVMDFKFGSGTYVDVDDNEQAKIYAIGVMMELAKPVETVELTIVQPRFEGAAPVRNWTFKTSEVLDFVADAQAAAERTRDPRAELLLEAGDWCKFCKAARTCPELERKQNELVAAEFGAIADYKQLAAALAAIPQVKERIKAIEEFAYTEAQAGRFGEEHGYKLVDKVPRRKWKSEGDVIEWAQANAIDPYEKSLKSPAAIEKELAATAPKGKKKEAGKVLEPLAEKVSSGTVLVTLADNRPTAKRIAAEDFAVIENAA